MSRQVGFTLIELVIVIVILGIISVVAAPRIIGVATDAKISALQNISSQIKSTNKLIQAKAIIKGLSPVARNPGDGQSNYVVDFSFGSVEVDFRSLCAEASGEFGDKLDFIDFMNITRDGSLEFRTSNQYALIGYDVPASGVPTDQGCYVIYNSFSPTCDVTIVTDDC